MVIEPDTFARLPLRSVIDCHTHYKMSRELLFDAYCEGDCDFVDSIGAVQIASIDKIITASRSIPLDVKRAILPSAL